MIQSSSFPHGNADIRQQFDRVLVDVPCSNSGVLSGAGGALLAERRCLEAIAGTTTGPAEGFRARLGPGGRLVYSTCSIWPDENQQVISAFLADCPALRKLREEVTLPQSGTSPAAYHDGGYFAIMGR